MSDETIISHALPLEHIVGLDEAKKVLEGDLTLRAIKTKPQKLVLLEGPSGTCKTTIVRSMVKFFKDKYPGRFFYKELMTYDVTEHVTSTARLISTLFEAIERTASSKVVVLLMDEVDELLSTRKDAGHIRTERTSNIMKGINKNIPNLYIVATTNRPKQTDKAALERFNERIHCGLPGVNEYSKLVDIYFPDMDKPYRDILFQYIVDCKYPWSGRDILHLADRIDDAMEVKQLTVHDYKLVKEDITTEFQYIVNSKAHLKDDYLDD